MNSETALGYFHPLHQSRLVLVGGLPASARPGCSVIWSRRMGSRPMSLLSTRGIEHRTLQADRCEASAASSATNSAGMAGCSDGRHRDRCAPTTLLMLILVAGFLPLKTTLVYEISRHPGRASLSWSALLADRIPDGVHRLGLRAWAGSVGGAGLGQGFIAIAAFLILTFHQHQSHLAGAGNRGAGIYGVPVMNSFEVILWCILLSLQCLVIARCWRSVFVFCGLV